MTFSPLPPPRKKRKKWWLWVCYIVNIYLAVDTRGENSARICQRVHLSGWRIKWWRWWVRWWGGKNGIHEYMAVQVRQILNRPNPAHVINRNFSGHYSLQICVTKDSFQRHWNKFWRLYTLLLIPDVSVVTCLEMEIFYAEYRIRNYILPCVFGR